jgi:hypothetical protein
MKFAHKISDHDNQRRYKIPGEERVIINHSDIDANHHDPVGSNNHSFYIESYLQAFFEKAKQRNSIIDNSNLIKLLIYHSI